MQWSWIHTATPIFSAIMDKVAFWGRYFKSNPSSYKAKVTVCFTTLKGLFMRRKESLRRSHHIHWFSPVLARVEFILLCTFNGLFTRGRIFKKLKFISRQNFIFNNKSQKFAPFKLSIHRYSSIDECGVWKEPRRMMPASSSHRWWHCMKDKWSRRKQECWEFEHLMRAV